MSIRTAESEDDVQAVGELWQEYWSSIGLAPSFQGFAQELQSLPGVYGGARGRLLLAACGRTAAGTVAMRPLSDEACEAKRLFVRPAFRHCGIARELIQRLIAAGRQCGYDTMYCDSLPSMTDAISLYRRFGFVEVAPYSASPTPGAIYLALSLCASR